MFLSRRARAIDAKQFGAPAEDARRLAHPANYFSVLQFARDAYPPRAAHDGVVLVRTLCLQAGRARPAPRWKRVIHQDNAEFLPLPDRASGVLEEVAKVMDHVKADCRLAVFGHHVTTLKFQGGYLGVAKQLYEQLAPLLSDGTNAADRRLKQTFAGDWPFPLSCRGRRGGSARPGRSRNLCNSSARPRVAPPAVAMWRW